MATPTMPTPFRSAGNQIVSQLESIAESFGSLAPPTNTQTTNTQPSQKPAAPVSTQASTTVQAQDVRKRRNTKTNNKKSKKNKVNSDNTAPRDINVADIIAENKTAVELRCLAEKHAQTGMSQEVFQSVLNFHEEIQTLIAIKALELGTTVSVIEEIFMWGFVLHIAGGIGSGEAMRELSAKWAEMEPSEKDTYKKVTEDTSHLDEGLAELDFGQQARDEILQPRTTILQNPRCLKTQKEAAVRLLDKTLVKCIPVAKANGFEVAIIAVSRHIAKHSFQLTKNTIGIDKALEIIYEKDGEKALPVQLQSYIVGKTPAAMTADLENIGKRYQSRVVHALSAFLMETTGLKNWPWSKCDKTLADAGYKLKLLPGARSDINTFKTTSKALNQAKLVSIKKDLQENLIHQYSN
ncbi:uncharacterized protein MELLADRAFT_96268 [Melampsora larici-populina 98AG31]|uniref:Uncharacterized protein n=1 Tax=Melampsora larici-populina (strain 98AG31 / pathotype 3-4-7) TaxID=747676 RepID=F4RE58_MELLP|nr:uncharacterized protein MELLADRAFT_96268 [Melampsora larici-populina 98AG31]EGG09328.1 hypothetical protein MELLADRAFT_96268 [Melampsora larici-populina 98AG31]